MFTEELKQRTDTHHRNIEDVTRLKRVFAEDYRWEEYIDLLKKFHGFYAPLEARFLNDRALMSEFDYASRRKAPRLREDLKHLGVSDAEIDALPECGNLPELNSTARLVGCMYVLEGATMGGQIISKNLAKTLQLDPEHGINFYACYGKDTMTYWKDFKDFMNRKFSTPQDLEEVSSAAGETFTALQNWLKN